MSAGLAALAAVLQGVGEKAPGFVDKYNAGIASKNRGAILGWGEEASLTWAREQQKLRQLEQDAKAANVTLPEGGAEKRAVLADHGVDPDADLPFDKWVAKKRGTKGGVKEIQSRLNEMGAGLDVDGILGPKSVAAMDVEGRARAMAEQDPMFRDAMERGGMTAEQALKAAQVLRSKQQTAGLPGEVAQQAEAAQGMAGGRVDAGQRETTRAWGSNLAEGVMPQANALMSDILSRKERGASDLDLEEERLRYQMSLLQPYASQLDKEDLPALLKRVENIGAAKKERGGQDEGMRGDQVRLLTGLLGFDRAMTQTTASAEARAAEGEKNRALKGNLEKMKEAGRNRREGWKLAFKKDQAFNDFVKYDAGNSLKALQAAQRNSGMIANAIKGKRPDQVAQILKGFGLSAEVQKPFFGKATVEWDEESVREAISAAAESYQDAAARLRKSAKKQAGEKPDEVPSSGYTWVKGTDGIMRKVPK